MQDSWSAGPNAELHSAGVCRATAVWQESSPHLYSLLSFVPSALPSSSLVTCADYRASPALPRFLLVSLMLHLVRWWCLQVALRWFCSRSLMRQEGLTKELIDRIPGKQTDRKTPLGELNWIFTAITDTIAWNMLPRSLFQRLFRQANLHTSQSPLLTSQSHPLPSLSYHSNLLLSSHISELHSVTQSLPANVAVSTASPLSLHLNMFQGLSQRVLTGVKPSLPWC